MKYAVAVAGVAATVAVIETFRVDHSVLVAGIFFTIGLMYIILSFSRFSSQPAKATVTLNVIIAWIFSALIAIVAALVVTAISFGWPRPLRALFVSTVLPHNSYWKIKVYEFADYGDDAARNYAGKRFASQILDELQKGEIRASRELGDSAISIVAQRGPVYDASRIPEYSELIPAIVVAGDVHDSDVSRRYAYTVRVVAVLKSGIKPVFNRQGEVVLDEASLSAAAREIARDISVAAEQYSTTYPN